MTRLFATLAACLVFAVVLAAESSAQGRRMKYSRELSTVKELRIETGRLGEQAKQCGLTETDLEAPARAALGKSRLGQIQSASDLLFINTMVVADGDACAAAINVELFRWSNEYQAAVSVWQHGALITGGSDGVSSRVREKVDALVRDFIDDWTKSRR